MAPFDLENIQGDIWPGLPKRQEVFLFFRIADDPSQRQKFKVYLRNLIPDITTAKAVLDARARIREEKDKAAADDEASKLLPWSGVNIAFSSTGLAALGKHIMNTKVNMEEIRRDPAKWRELKKNQIRGDLFDKGMFDDLVYEGWDDPQELRREYKKDPETKQRQIDGVVFVAASTQKQLEKAVGLVKEKLHMRDIDDDIDEDAACKLILTRKGKARPDQLKGKEHFGFEDGISQPQLEGLDPPPKGEKEPKAVPPGLIIIGHDGDALKQPAWTKDGSFMVFRDLQQLVPEFDQFLEDNAHASRSTEKSPASPNKLGALIMGRWRNGTPVDLNPHDDNDPSLYRSNNFNYTPVGSHDRCPFAAHIRKMRPRADLDDDEAVIIRRGIAYGPEVSEEEKRNKKTSKERGMLFVCYQSDIRNGFNFLTTRWASNHHFPSNKYDAVGLSGPGIDGIAGQRLAHHPPRNMGLPDGKKPSEARLSLGAWVTHKGGEYFFAPSLKALREDLSSAPLQAKL
ncbi:dye-decolorizing peroxidase msp1 [Aspergillus udagawae]|nr:dye-decolorizing peroxidase msp1 [Aspergillus udagawae]GFF59323.1 dye-decolorizing peroxidase msp1 [Aspergillus udagawae]